MLRALAVMLVAATPALAWEFRSGEVCEIVHAEETGSVRVTYDPAIREYAIEIAPAAGWGGAPLFAMRFDGPRNLTIYTDRHVVAGGTLTVRDRGFGNVLNGLEFNDTATALLGDQAVPFGLDGAAPAVQAFRDCTSGVGV